MSIKNILTINVLLCAIATASAASMPFLHYFGGRRGMWYSYFLFPVDFVPILLGALCTFALLINLIRSGIQRKNIAGPCIALVLAFSSFLVSRSFKPTTTFLIGFHERVKTLASPDDLLQLASVARRVAPANEKSFRPDTPRQISRRDKAWDELAKEPIIGRLHPGSVFVDDHTVTLYWGNALTGHWGILIRNSGGLRSTAQPTFPQWGSALVGSATNIVSTTNSQPKSPWNIALTEDINVFIGPD